VIFLWEDGSAVDFTNWDDNQFIVNRVGPTRDDSGDMCIEAKNLDMKWRQSDCWGDVRNLYICQTKKVPKLSATTSSSASSIKMSVDSKIVNVIGVVMVVITIAFSFI